MKYITNKPALNFRTGLLASAIAFSLVACISIDNTNNVDSAKSGTFTVLHTNDNHGRFWENRHGEYGMAARKTLIDTIRADVEASGGELLVLSGGDINTGVPESDLQDAEPDFIGMNAIGYDAMAVGNHEFDNPLSVLEMQRKWADFPMLSANIYKRQVNENGEEELVRYFKPYQIFELDGIKAAVIGLTTEDTKTIGNPEIVGDLVFTSVTEETKKVIAEIKEDHNVDVIFATTHMGHYANGQHGSNAPGDVKLANSLEEGQLQAIFGGHSQNPVCMRDDLTDYADFIPGEKCVPDSKQGTYIMQAYEWGKYVGRADFSYESGQLELLNYQLIPVNIKVKNDKGERVLVSDEITPDQSLLMKLKPYKKQGEAKLDEVIAKSEVQWERGSSNKQIKLGHLIATSNSTKLKTDFAVMNSGGIRAAFEAGNITYRDVLTVQPFGNMVTLNKMTGAEVAGYLGIVASKQVGSGGFAQLNNLKMDVDCSTQSVDIKDINGKGFSESAVYTFTVPSYSASGGDGYPKLNYVDSGYSDAEVLYGFLKEKGDVNPTEFEPDLTSISYLNSLSETGCELKSN